MNHTFIVASGINKNVILGKDWLSKVGVRLYFDLQKLRVGKTYVPLQPDIHIHAIVRLKDELVMKPQTSYTCTGKMQNRKEFPPDSYEISQVTEGYVASEPGVLVSNSLVNVKKNRKLPLFIVNSTTKTIRLKKNCIVAKAEKVQINEINHVEQSNLTPSNSKKNNQVNNSNEWLNNIYCPEKHTSEIRETLQRNRDVFALNDLELTQTDTVTMDIKTTTDEPIRQKPYFTPLKNRPVVDKAIDDMLAADIIRPSSSPWRSPIVIVPKKDGSKRFCVDFRKLNAVTKPNSYPLPKIDEILALLGGSQYFSALDCRQGYFQVKMEESSREKTAFCCSRGLFEFNVMPFGLSNAPGKFQELMSRVLRDCSAFALPYLDDIIIFSKNFEDHLRHLELVFSKLREHNLKLKPSKCHFAQSETNYLGFVVNGQGIRPDPNKVQSIRDLPTPTSVRDVRAFIGMCYYFRRIILNFSKTAEPLIALTRKYARFNWDNQCEKSYQDLKNDLTKVPLLGYPDISQSFKIYTDASDSAIGAVLVQDCGPEDSIVPGIPNEKPIHFYSHKLNKTQRKWSTIERETFAIKMALEKFDPYVHGCPITLFTDHKPCIYLLSSPMQNRKIQQWALCIAGYDVKIEWLAGKRNTVADMLSRIDYGEPESDCDDNCSVDICDNTFCVETVNSNMIQPSQFVSNPTDEHAKVNMTRPEIDIPNVNMVDEQAKDEQLKSIKIQLSSNDPPKSVSKYLLLDDVLYYVSEDELLDEVYLRLCIPSHLCDMVLGQYHDLLGHMGTDKCYSSLKQKYYWKNMYRNVAAYVAKCITCNARARKTVRTPVQETEIPNYPFRKICIDIHNLPTTLAGNKYLVGFIDVLSGWVEAFPVKYKTAENVAHLFLEEIWPRFGVPSLILTDNGKEFVNETMKYITNALGIAHIQTSYYNPRANKIERWHRFIDDVISKTADDNNWDIYHNQCLAATRFAPSAGTKYSPYFLLYGRDVMLPLDNILQKRKRYNGEEGHKICLQRMHYAFSIAHKNLKKAKKRQQNYANKDLEPADFEVGDAVFYQNHQKTSKIDNNYLPYYRVIEKRSPLTVLIKNILTSKVDKAHATNIKHANLENWEISDLKSLPPETDANIRQRPERKATYVVPPSDSSGSEISSGETEIYDPDPLIKKFRFERTDSSSVSDDDVPLAELSKKMRRQKHRVMNHKSGKQLSPDISDVKTDQDNGQTSESDHEMEVDYLQTVLPKMRHKPKAKSKNKDSQIKQLGHCLKAIFQI